MDDKQVMVAVRTLKGAPASIMLALSIAPEGAVFQVPQLVTMTGYSEQGVHLGLRVLETLGLVRSWSTHQGWMLAAQLIRLS